MKSNSNRSEEFIVEIELESSRSLLGKENNQQMSQKSSESGTQENTQQQNQRTLENPSNNGMRSRGVSFKSLNTSTSNKSQEKSERRTLTRTDQIRQREIEAIQGISEDIFDDSFTSHSKHKSWKIRWFGNSEGLIHPACKFRKWWDVILVYAIFYTCFQTTFKWAFDPPFPSGLQTIISHSYSPVMIFFYVIEIFVDFLYVLDLIINSRTGYFAFGGAIMDPILIRKQYFGLQFKFDFLACVPIIFDVMYPFYSHPLSFRFIKLLQLLKLYGFYGRYEIISEAIANYYSTLHSSILTLFCALLVIVNWLACIWFFTLTYQPGGIANSWLNTLPDLSESIELWVTAENSETFFEVPVNHQFKLYIASFYWASSAGDGFDATTTSERLCSIIGQFLVVNGMGAFIIASIMRAIDDYDISGQKYNMYRRKIDGVNAFMSQHLLPYDLQDSVRRYYHEVWTREKLDFTEVKMLEELPEYLRQPIMQHITRQMISTSKFFSEYLKGDSQTIESEEDKEVWADAISRRLRPKFATPGEYVIRQGDTGTDMFMIKQGKVAVEVDDNVVAHQSSGSYFGDIALLGNTMSCRLRTASIRAITYCELFILGKEDLECIFREHPSLKIIMEQVASAKFRRSVSNQIEGHIADHIKSQESST